MRLHFWRKPRHAQPDPVRDVFPDIVRRLHGFLETHPATVVLFFGMAAIVLFGWML